MDAATPGARDVFFWDEKLSGFGLKVTPAGGRIYIYQYRLAAPGKAQQTAPRRYTIGKHGALTPDQARKRAQELSALVVQGVDPAELEQGRWRARDEAKRKADEQARLHHDLAFTRKADMWLTHYQDEQERRPKSVQLARLVVKNHLKPALGDKPLPHITRSDLQHIIDKIPGSKKALRRAVFAYANVLFRWAAGRGDIGRNPMAEMVRPPAPKPRNRVLSDDELRSVWAAAVHMPYPWGTFFRLAILTGQRREEVAGMQWSELDRATKEWTIPGERSKNGLPHIVPLSDAVIAELDKQAGGREWSKSGFTLTTTGINSISGISKAKRALDERAFEMTGSPLPAWRIHDIRRTVATGLQRLGVRFEVTEAVLNHISGSKGGLAGVYQRHDWKAEKREALAAWALHMASIGLNYEFVTTPIEAQLG